MKREPNLPRFGRESSFPETSLGAYLPAAPKKRESEETPLAPSAAVTAFVAALDRLEQTIDQETALLENHKPADMEDINNRKSRSLLELTRLGRVLPATSPRALRQRIERLQAKLQRNQSVLKLNLDAVREIAGLLLGALGEAESDGTYDMPHERQSAAR